MSEDPIKRLAWLRADCDGVRAMIEEMPADWFQERMEMAMRIEEHEREIAELERALDTSMVEALSATTAIDALAALMGAP